ncbi:MAG: hypothetical protein HQ518_16470 [Rhodopirellula sp.]|nr:hypothetical protein [Rhodopirellula sp.]
MSSRDVILYVVVLTGGLVHVVRYEVIGMYQFQEGIARARRIGVAGEVMCVIQQNGHKECADSLHVKRIQAFFSNAELAYPGKGGYSERFDVEIESSAEGNVVYAGGIRKQHLGDVTLSLGSKSPGGYFLLRGAAESFLEVMRADQQVQGD